MPGRDGTGPMGMGAASGRGAGFCRVSKAPGKLGLGLGFRRNFSSSASVETPEDRVAMLEEQKSMLKNRLDLLNELDTLKKKD